MNRLSHGLPRHGGTRGGREALPARVWHPAYGRLSHLPLLPSPLASHIRCRGPLLSTLIWAVHVAQLPCVLLFCCSVPPTHGVPVSSLFWQRAWTWLPSRERMAVRNAVQSGNVEDAIDRVNDLNPGGQ